MDTISHPAENYNGSRANGRAHLPHEDKAAPHDNTAEDGFLGCMLRDRKAAANGVQLVREHQLHNHDSRLIYRAIAKLVITCQPVEPEIVISTLRADGVFETEDEDCIINRIGELYANAPLRDNIEAFAKFIIEMAGRRQFARMLSQMATESSRGVKTAAELIELVTTRARDISESELSTDDAEFGLPVVASELQEDEINSLAIWKSLIGDKEIALFSALWKCGKTTLLSHLLRATKDGTMLCGREVSPATVLYVTEESKKRWRKRRDKLAIGDNVYFWCRPLNGKPTFAKWVRFIEAVKRKAEKIGANLIVFDTIAAFWPVRNENEASEVQEALMPLLSLTVLAAVLLVHHLKKADGGEGTGSRGSGALTGFVDTIIELRRHEPKNHDSRKRVITAYGRDEDTPPEIIIELSEDGMEYRAFGTREDEHKAAIRQSIDDLLPRKRPGMTYEEIKAAWPEDKFPRKTTVTEVIDAAVQCGDYTRDGQGRKGDPHRYSILQFQ